MAFLSFSLKCPAAIAELRYKKANIIKKNPNFFDENNNFSRLKYEKFLLTNQIDAPTFERRLKERELQNNLFNFISGGIYSPLFLTKKLYENETKKNEIK